MSIDDNLLYHSEVERAIALLFFNEVLLYHCCLLHSLLMIVVTPTIVADKGLIDSSLIIRQNGR